METRRRKLLEKCFGRWSAGKARSVLMAATLLGLAAATQQAHALTPGYGGCGFGGYGGSIRQLDKNTGAFVRVITDCEFTPGGMSDDPTTFGSQFTEILWTKDPDPFTNQLEAIEIPGGTLGQRLGPPVASPGSCPADFGGNVASDGDGLLDCWKRGDLWSDGKPGINYAGNYAVGGDPANRDVVLCVPANTATPAADCAQPNRKDLFLEIDYMQFHRPSDAAVQAVKDAFSNAPTPPGPITLHVLVDEQITFRGSSHYNNLAFVPCTGPATSTDPADFDAIKALFFGTSTERASANALNAKALAYRYSLWVHNLLGLGSTSGCAEILGNDFVVSMGSWGSVNVGTTSKPVFHNVGTQDQTQSTLLHEFGHTLGLRHGGGDNMNCKPNEVSVMNYTNQFLSPLSKVQPPTRPLDYSRAAFGGPITLPDGTAATGLDKNNLMESTGIGPVTDATPVAYGPVPTFGVVAVAEVSLASQGIDWNQDRTIAGTFSLDVDQTTNASGGCPAAQLGPPNNPSGQFLVSYNEWALVQLNFRSSVDFGEGGHVTSGETTLVLDPNTGLPVPAGTPGITREELFAFEVGVTNDVIDIRPGNDKNEINVNSNQDIEVAILSRPDAPGVPGLNATTVDPASITLSGTDGATWVLTPKQNGAGKFECDIRDASHDKLKDLVCHFKVPKGTIALTETRAVLQATTLPPGSHPVLGSDVISPKP